MLNSVLFGLALSVDAILNYIFISKVYNINKSQITVVSLITGLLHLLLPLISVFIVSRFLTSNQLIIEILSIGFFFYMIMQLLFHDDQKLDEVNTTKLLTLSFFVSIDSFLSGPAIINLSSNVSLTLLIIFILTTLLSLLSLLLGKRVSKKIPNLTILFGVLFYSGYILKTIFSW